MSIREVAEKRAKSRAECRIVADELLETILKRLDSVPEDQQSPVVAMLVTELSIATRKVGNEGE
jgi:hypothetical protein